MDDIAGFEEKFDEDIPRTKTGVGFSATDIRQPFVSWLNNNIDKEQRVILASENTFLTLKSIILI